MMEPMTSSPSSKVTTLALLLVLSLAAVAPAAAINVASQDVPSEAEVGTTVEATFALDTLYQEPNFQSWALQGQTELENVTWVVAYQAPDGSTFANRQYSGQSFSQQGIDADSGSEPFQSPVTAIEVTVRGEVPAVEQYTYDEREQFVVAELSQRGGASGSTNTVDTWGTHHYTTGTEAEPGSQQAREAIESAESAIVEAENAGADTSGANETVDSAISAYENENFANAVNLANDAEEQADQARQDAESSAQTTQLLMYGGLAVLVLALVGGGYWYYQQQQSDYDKLG